MISCSEKHPELRRCRPILGTLVEITTLATSGAMTALDHAFSRIARVHTLMSTHEASSDLGRISAAPVGTAVLVHPWTWSVLFAAQRLNHITKGAFDPVVAGRLALARGDLPQWPNHAPAPDSHCSDLELMPGNRVCSHRPLRLDLGGIAKGFAVDQAVRSLKRAGLAWGLVNAGGDLRALGSRAWPVHVRHPSAPGQLVSLGSLQEGAVATSAPYFSKRIQHEQATSALIDPATGESVVAPISATVFARTCLIADALTKAVLLGDAVPALRACRARGFVLTAEGAARHAA